MVHMKPRTIVPLVIGLGVGVFAIKMGIDMVQRAKGAQSGETGVVVVEKRLDPGTQITSQMVGVKRVPAALLPPDAISDAKAVVGRVTMMTVPAGMPLTGSMLAPPGSKPGLRALIPPGKRAVSVSVNEEACVGGFVMPGCRVDVSAVDRSGQSRLILSDVEVGAVGQSISEAGPDGKTTQMAKSVTLFVDEDQVQVVHAYTGQGKIKLALRGNGKDPGEGLLSRLLAKATAPREPAPVRRESLVQAPPRYNVVEILRGSELQRVVFDETGACYPYDQYMSRMSAGAAPVGAPAALKSARSVSETRE